HHEQIGADILQAALDLSSEHELAHPLDAAPEAGDAEVPAVRLVRVLLVEGTPGEDRFEDREEFKTLAPHPLLAVGDAEVDHPVATLAQPFGEREGGVQVGRPVKGHEDDGRHDRHPLRYKVGLPSPTSWVGPGWGIRREGVAHRIGCDMMPSVVAAGSAVHNSYPEGWTFHSLWKICGF